MSFRISLSQLAQIIKPIALSNSVNLTTTFIKGISTDSRSLQPEEAFLALRGRHFDGHDFVETALSQGAIALILEEPPSVELRKQIPLFIVNNTLEAYQRIAQWWRSLLTLPIIGVTGSVGKTTTKELIAAVLSNQGRVLKTEANYNNEIGVPKTILGIDSSHNYGVIEMAMRAPGEIGCLTKIVSPEIGVITNVGTAHIERLGSVEAIARAKCELLAEMPPDGIAILNHDNQRLLTTAREFWPGETVTFGLEGGDICGQLLDHNTLKVEGLKLPLPLRGRHNALNYLAAIAVAKVLSVDLTPLTQGLVVSIPSGRAKTYQLDRDILILDETYNAGLESMLAALELLRETPGKRRIAVLGTMKELGEQAVNYHHQVGVMVKKLGIDYLCVYADETATEAIATGADGVDKVIFNNQNQLVSHLKTLIQPGDRLLFKASRSVKLDQVLQQLLAW